MPASGISSELSAHQMAPPEAIAHSRGRLCPRASSLSFSSLVSPLRPLGLGLLGRCDPRSFVYFYDVTDAGPASHRVRLWQGGPASTYCRFPGGYSFSWGGRGEMAMAVASSARLAFLHGAVCASTMYIRCCPFVPCAATVHRAPGHNRWGVSETTLRVKTQGRTLDCPFNFRPPRIVAGWFFVLCRPDPLA